MHSRPRVPKDPEKEKAKLEKALVFQKAFRSILEKRANGIKNKEMLSACQELLYKVPELSTLWNYRREILLDLKNKSEGLDELCAQELSFTEQCLIVNPKAYQSWHHRVWLLSYIPQPDLQRELELCALFLKKDERNFHCWDYRRQVAKLAGVDIASELSFTDAKLKENFSNFSAWHMRSCLLTQLAREGGDDLSHVQRLLDQDFETVQAAIFTDPSDQSIWFYFRWLLTVYSKGLNWLAKLDKPFSASINECTEETGKLDSSKLDSLKQLLDIEPDNKWLNLTFALLNSDSDSDSAIEKLIQIDPLRVNYYRDLKRKISKRQAVSRP